MLMGQLVKTSGSFPKAFDKIEGGLSCYPPL
jgi:hypothetical protein